MVGCVSLRVACDASSLLCDSPLFPHFRPTDEGISPFLPPLPTAPKVDKGHPRGASSAKHSSPISLSTFHFPQAACPCLAIERRTKPVSPCTRCFTLFPDMMDAFAPVASPMVAMLHHLHHYHYHHHHHPPPPGLVSSCSLAVCGMYGVRILRRRDKAQLRRAATS